VHKNDNSSLHNFWVIALWFFSYYYVRSLSQKVFEVSTWNFIGEWISLRKSAVHKNDNSTLHNCLVIALWFFSYYFVRRLSQKVFEVSTWNFIGGWITLRKSAVHKNDNSTLHDCLVIALFSSPEPTAQGELLVSKGDAPASVIRRPSSCVNNRLLLWNYWTDLLQIWKVASLWQSHLNLLMSFQFAPLRGQQS
jgi:hypothetical protein